MKGACLAVFALSAAVAAAADTQLAARARVFPPISELPATPFAMQDAAMASAGLRATGADLAWIQLLQYSGDGLPELTSPPGRRMSHLKDLSLRVTRLDPSFHRAYLYGASLLAWLEGVNRPEEAVEILQEGLRRDPGEPLYSLYLAALAYQKRGDVEKTIGLLETTVDDPRAPAMMKSILAILYKQRGDYARSMAMWERVLDDESDVSEHQRAAAQIDELERLLRAKGRR